MVLYIPKVKKAGRLKVRVVVTQKRLMQQDSVESLQNDKRVVGITVIITTIVRKTADAVATYRDVAVHSFNECSYCEERNARQGCGCCWRQRHVANLRTQPRSVWSAARRHTRCLASVNMKPPPPARSGIHESASQSHAVYPHPARRDNQPRGTDDTELK